MWVNIWVNIIKRVNSGEDVKVMVKVGLHLDVPTAKKKTQVNV